MKRLRESWSSLTNKLSEGLQARLMNRSSRVWLALFALSLLLLVFNLPVALIPQLGFLPLGTFVAITLAGFVCSTLGTRRGLILAGSAAGIVVPFFQPLLALPVVAALGIGVAVCARRRGYRRPRLIGAVCVPVAFAFYVLAAMFLLPLLHVVTTSLFMYFSTAVALTFAIALSAFLARRRQKRLADGLPASRVRWAIGGVALLMLWAYVPFTVVVNRSETIQSLQLRHSMNPEVMEELPVTVQDRVLPRPTAETYMMNLNNDFMTSVDPPHLQSRPGGLWWQSPVHNENRWGRIFGSTKRVVAVDADREDAHSEETPDSGFIFSEKSWVVQASFALRHPFSKIADTCYYQNSDGSWSLLLTYTSNKVSTSLPAPGTMIPYFAGVMEVSQLGVIRDWPVQQAAKRFPGAVLYPTQLFRQQAEAYGRWRNGWTGTNIWQSQVLEISEDNSPDVKLNPQPYVQHFRDHGLQLMVSFEPKGDKAYAWTEMLLGDAGTGKLRTVTPPKGLVSPRMALQNVRSSDNRFDWSRIRKVEPRLVVAPRGVYWLIAIVAHWENEPDRHPYTASVLVDAKRPTENFPFQRAKEINQFLEQKPQE